MSTKRYTVEIILPPDARPDEIDRIIRDIPRVFGADADIYLQDSTLRVDYTLPKWTPNS